MKPNALLATIFDDDCETPCAFVSVSTVASDKSRYEPVLKFIEKLNYNDFNGKAVAAFLRKNILAENKNGAIVDIRFGREYSPVLYLTISAYDFKKDKKLTDKEREKLGLRILGRIKRELKPNELRLDGRVIRAWFD
jgi:hypothetical protein